MSESIKLSRPVATHESVAAHERFKEALATPVGPTGNRHRRAS